MDLDPNYDPSDFLTMHNRMGNSEANQNQQGNNLSQFLQNEEGPNENMTSQHDGNNSNMHQMPLMMGSNDNMGIDDDLAISESDEEDEGNVRIKREIFVDQHEENEEEQQQEEQSMIDLQMQEQQQEQLPQPYAHTTQDQYEASHHQTQNQSHHDDNNDDDWLRF